MGQRDKRKKERKRNYIARATLEWETCLRILVLTQRSFFPPFLLPLPVDSLRSSACQCLIHCFDVFACAVHSMQLFQFRTDLASIKEDKPRRLSAKKYARFFELEFGARERVWGSSGR